MSQLKYGSRFSLSALSAGALVALLGLILGSAHPTQAALVEGGKGPHLLIGFDDENRANAMIQAFDGIEISRFRAYCLYPCSSDRAWNIQRSVSVRCMCGRCE